MVSCGPNVPPTYATDAGNCIHFIDDSADEYVAYLADVRRVTGCSLGDLRKCSPPIKLEIIAYPTHISRKQFENPDYLSGEYPHARLRTTSLVDYDLWLSQRFIEDPWDASGYEVRFRDGTGSRLVPKSFDVAMKEHRFDCKDIVVLSARAHVDIDIPLVGSNLSELNGNVLMVRAGYYAHPSSIPKALAGAFPSLGLAISNPIVVAVE